MYVNFTEKKVYFAENNMQINRNLFIFVLKRK